MFAKVIKLKLWRLDHLTKAGPKSIDKFKPGEGREGKQTHRHRKGHVKTPVKIRGEAKLCCKEHQEPPATEEAKKAPSLQC